MVLLKYLKPLKPAGILLPICKNRWHVVDIVLGEWLTTAPSCSTATMYKSWIFPVSAQQGRFFLTMKSTLLHKCDPIKSV